MKIQTIDLTEKISDFNRGESVNLDFSINSNEAKDPKALKDGIIKSNIDGGTEYTNIQDKNTNDWSNLGSIIGGSFSNSLGITNKDISDIGSIVDNITAMINPDKAKTSDFDRSMTKINEWKNKAYKDLHPFDWKPGQTVPKDLMKSSIGSFTNDMINMWGKEGTKDKFRKATKYISPDPIKYVRDSMKSSKGIDPNQEVFKVQSEEAEPYKDTSAKNFSNYNKSDEETKFINALKNKNTFNKTLGYIYIKPKYNYNNGENDIAMQIPFEFNPEISGDGNQASYVSETLLNRIGQFHVYTGTNLSQLSVSLKYIALSPDYTEEKDIAKQFSTDIWQYYWTNSRIESIEYQLRSLVFPDVTSADYLIRPPLIELHLGNGRKEIENVGDLYKYPIELNVSNNYNSDSNYLSVTRSVNGNVNRYKKYIVTNVQIDPINEDSYMWPSYYGRVWDNNSKSGSIINHIKNVKDFKSENKLNNNAEAFSDTRRTGFRATLQLLEVTENFLDIVPDFKSYYNAWNAKRENADVTYKNSSYLLGGDAFVDKLQTELLDKAKSIEDEKNDLAKLFKEAYELASLYKYSVKDGSEIKKFNEAKFGEKLSKDEYYYANSKWFYKENKTVEKIDPDNDPVFFNVELKGNFEKFITSENELPIKKPEGKATVKQNVYEKVYTEEELIGTKGKPEEGSSILNKLSTEEFCIDKDHPDYLGLFSSEKDPKYKYDKDGKLSYIFQETSNANKYTDAECFLILNRMLDLSKELDKRSSNININKDSWINNMKRDFLNTIGWLKSVDLKDIENGKGDYSFCINFYYTDVKLNNLSYDDNIDKFFSHLTNEYKEELKKLIGDIYEVLYEENIGYEPTSTLREELEFSRKCNLFLKKYFESILHTGGLSYDNPYKISDQAKKIIENITQNNVFSNLENDFIKRADGQQSNEIETTFEKIINLWNSYDPTEGEKEHMNLINAQPIAFLNKMKKRCEDCLELMLNSISIFKTIVKYNSSYENCMKDAGTYLSKSILCGDNIKCIKKARPKKVNLKYISYTTSSNDYSGTNKSSLKEVENIYSTYIQDQGITILNARKIMDAMVEGFNKALEELSPIRKKLLKIGEENLTTLNKTAGISSFKIDEENKEIKFAKDEETYFLNAKDKEENFKNYMETLDKDLLINFGLGEENNYSSSCIKELLDLIIYIKKAISSENIEKSFHKIVGSPQKDEDGENYNGIIGLKMLKDGYKDYSKNENSLREEVFKEWDKTQTFASADALVNNGLFKETFNEISNGKIPNKYCVFLERLTNVRSLKIASNNIEDYEKLSE